MRMRIALITSNYPRYPGDGASTAGLFVAQFCAELKRLGHRVYVLTQKLPGKLDAGDMNVRWFNWSGAEDDEKISSINPFSIGGFFKTRNLLKNGTNALRRLVKKKGIDHCICMWAIPSGYFANKVKAELGVNYSVWVLGSDIWTFSRYPIIGGIVRNIIDNSQFVVSDGLKLARQVEEITGRRCGFMPSSRKLPQPQKRPEMKGQINLLFIGRYEPVKGPDLLIRAARRLVKKGRDIHVFMFGGGSMRAELKEMIERYKLKERVHLQGYIDAQGCSDWLSAASCLVIPSRMESIPVIFSDAMQMGCPVVASNVGDMGTLIKKYKVGIVTKPKSKAIAKSIGEFIDKREAWDGFRSEALRLAEKFDANRVAERYVGLINSKSRKRKANNEAEEKPEKGEESEGIEKED